MPLDADGDRQRRAAALFSRRGAIGSLLASLAAAGGVVTLRPGHRELVGPREIEIPSGPSPFGSLIDLRGEMAGKAKLVDVRQEGHLTPVAKAPPAAEPAPIGPLPAMLNAPPLDLSDAPLPAPAAAADASKAKDFVLGKGKYTPADLAYIDREAPKTDRGMPGVRGLWLINPHTKEELVTLFWSVGSYDNVAYSACCELMRDWRQRKTVAMDPKLLHLLWAIQRTRNFSEPLIITSGFRTIATNTMLRAEGSAVNSQHLHSRANDIVLGRTPPRETARVAQEFGIGGLGYYKTFTHVDTGPRRSWYG